MKQSESNKPRSAVSHEHEGEDSEDAAAAVISALLQRSSASLDRIVELDATLRQLRDLCDPARVPAQELASVCSSGSAEDFERLKNRCLAVIEADVSEKLEHDQSDPQKNQRLSDSAITLPDLAAFEAGFQVNVDHLSDLDHQLFLTRLQQARRAKLPVHARLQGVRIAARYPHDAARLPCHAVNSLTPLTGVGASIVGNAVFSSSPARDYHLPVDEGDVVINGCSIAECRGTVEELIEAINRERQQTRVDAAQLADGSLVLNSVDGVAIKLEVHSQAASLVSGFRMGSVFVPARSCGVIAWIAEQASELVFDSSATSLALNGLSEDHISLKRFSIVDLTFENATLAQISMAVIDRLCRALQAQYRHLVTQLDVLVEKYATDTDAGKRLRQWLDSLQGSLQLQTG